MEFQDDRIRQSGRPALACAGYRAVTPCMPGYTPSDIPGDVAEYGAGPIGRKILDLLSPLDKDKAFLVGHDWGAMAAHSAAAQDPSRLRALVTVAIPHPGRLRPSLAFL